MSQIAEAFVRIRPNMTGFKAETEAGVKAGLSGALRDAGKVVGGALAVGGLFEAVKHIVDAAAGHQAAFDVLDRAIQDAGASAQGFSANLKDILEQESRLKGFNTEDLASSMVRLVSVTKDTKRAFEDLREAEDLARARHIDIAAAALALSKAEQGSTTALQRYGIVVPKVGVAVTDLKTRHDEATAAGAKFTGQLKIQYDAALRAAQATDTAARRAEAFKLINERFGGAASTFANSAAGQFARFGEDVHQLEISIGTGLLPTLTGAAEGLRHLSEAAARSNIGPTVGAAFHDLGQALAFIGPVAATGGKALLDLAQVAEKAVSAIGAPALLVAVAVYKGIPAVMSLASAAQAAYLAVASRGAAAAVEDVAAKSADADATGTFTATLVANTAALEANTVAMAANAGAGDFYLASVAKAGAATRVAITAEEGLGAAGATGAVGLRAFGAGLVSMVNPMTATIGVAALFAGALVYIATREDATTRATKAYTAALSGLDKGLQHTSDLRQHLSDVTASIPTDKASIEQAKLTVEQDRFALATTHAAKGSFEYRQLVINLQRDVAGLGDSLHNLARNQKDAADTQGALRKQTSANAQGYDALVSQIAKVRNLEKDARSSFDFTPAGMKPAHRLQEFQDNLRSFIADLKKAPDLQTAALQHSIDLLKQFGESVGRFPTNKEIAVALTIKTPGATLDDFLNKLNGESKAKGKAGGHTAGLQYAQSFAQGILDGQSVVSRAIDALVGQGASRGLLPPNPPVRRASGGPVPGSGTTDTVPALLTPGEIVFNSSQQETLRKLLGLPSQGTPLDLFSYVDKTAAYQSRFAQQGKDTVQRFQGGGVALADWIRNARHDYSDAQIRGQIHRWHPDWPEATILNAIDSAETPRSSFPAGSPQARAAAVFSGSSVDHAPMRTDDLQRIGRAGSSPIVQTLGMLTNPIAMAKTLIETGGGVLPIIHSSYQFGYDPSLRSAAGVGANVGLFGTGFLPVSGAAARDTALAIATRSGRRDLAGSLRGYALANRGGGLPGPGQLPLFDSLGYAATPASHAPSLAGARADAESVVGAFEPLAAPIGPEFEHLVPNYFSPNEVAQFVPATEDILSLIGEQHGWPGSDSARPPIPIHMETSDIGVGHMRPDQRPGPLAPLHVAVRPERDVPGSLRDQMASVLAHEIGHALDYSILKWNPRQAFSGSISTALGERGRSPIAKAWQELNKAFIESPSVQRTVKARRDLDMAVRTGAHTPLQRNQISALIDHLDYVNDPTEIFARAYHQWIATRSGDPALLAGLENDFVKSNVASSGRANWVFGSNIELAKYGPNPEFDDIARGMENLFEAAGVLKGPGYTSAATSGYTLGPPRGAAAASDPMATIAAALGIDLPKGDLAKAASVPKATPIDPLANRGGRSREFFSYGDMIAPRITDPARRAEIGFPDLPEIPKDVQRGIYEASQRILRETRAPAGYSSLRTPKALAHRMSQIWQAGVLGGPEGQYWYENQGPYVLGFAGRENVKPRTAAEVLGIYSAQASPYQNMVKGTAAVRQFQQLGEIQAYTQVQAKAAEASLVGLPWMTKALKTTSYHQNLLTGALGPEAALAHGLDPLAVTNDRWVAVALKPWLRGDKRILSAPQYQFATRVAQEMRPLLGFQTPMQAQAAPWVTYRSLGLLEEEAGVFQTWAQALKDSVSGYKEGFNATMGGVDVPTPAWATGGVKTDERRVFQSTATLSKQANAPDWGALRKATQTPGWPRASGMDIAKFGHGLPEEGAWDRIPYLVGEGGKFHVGYPGEHHGELAARLDLLFDEHAQGDIPVRMLPGGRVSDINVLPAVKGSAVVGPHGGITRIAQPPEMLLRRAARRRAKQAAWMYEPGLIGRQVEIGPRGLEGGMFRSIEKAMGTIIGIADDPMGGWEQAVVRTDAGDVIEGIPFPSLKPISGTLRKANAPDWEKWGWVFPNLDERAPSSTGRPTSFEFGQMPAVRDALTAIEGAHGGVPRVPGVLLDSSFNANLGEYFAKGAKGIASRATIEFDQGAEATTVAHEFAHHLDATYFGAAGPASAGMTHPYANQQGPLAKFIESARGTAPFRWASGNESTGWRYFSRVDEMFARAYEQWVAKRSGVNLGTLALQPERAYWTPQEFAPLEKTLNDALLGRDLYNSHDLRSPSSMTLRKANAPDPNRLRGDTRSANRTFDWDAIPGDGMSRLRKMQDAPFATKRGTLSSPLTAMGRPKTEWLSSVPGYRFVRAKAGDTVFSYDGSTYEQYRGFGSHHQEGQPISVVYNAVGPDGKTVGTVDTSWAESGIPGAPGETNIHSVYLTEAARKKAPGLFRDMIKVATHRGGDIMGDIGNPRLGQMLSRLFFDREDERRGQPLTGPVEIPAWMYGPRFATGGLVPGSGSATGDTVPAFLSPGEIVLNHGQQQRLSGMLGMPGTTGGSLFSAIAGRYAGGGFVDPFPGGLRNPFAGFSDLPQQIVLAAGHGPIPLTPTVTVKPKLTVNAGELRKALMIVLENVVHLSAADAVNYLKGDTLPQLANLYEALIGPLSKAAKNGALDVVDAALDKSITSATKDLAAYKTQSAQTMASVRGDISDLKTQLSDAVKQEAVDVQTAVDSAKQNLGSLAGSVSQFISDYLNKPLQNEQQSLSRAADLQNLEALRRSALLPGGKRLSKDPTVALRQLEALEKKGGPNQLAIEDFTTKYRQQSLSVRQDRVNATVQSSQRRLADLTYLEQTNKITPAQYETRVKALLRRDHIDPAKAKSLLGIAAAGTFGEQESALFKQAGVIAGGPIRAGSGAVGQIVRPLDVLHRDQREIHRITKEIGNKQVELQKDIAKSAAKTAQMTGQILNLEKQRARHDGGSPSKAPGKTADSARSLNGVTH